MLRNVLHLFRELQMQVQGEYCYNSTYEDSICLFLARQLPSGPGPPHSRGFLDHTQRRTTVSRIPLDE